MKWVIVVLVLIAAGVVGLGFYQGWFHVSTGDGGGRPSVTVGVDENKMREDKKKVEGLGEKAKEDAAGRPVKDGEQRP